ncbi:hypothetical protein FA13DRAFT_1729006 [Coprinellus micaceus]|uniref:DUF6593 domain-containing protein n=1 Tax=Coprinellus micaceus TaxID=71717 RepID=A0A4Y7TNR1_COPMI|nr:hypothetical protein FA13DRAFT_1729006 [Coprinellus micaceus]
MRLVALGAFAVTPDYLLTIWALRATRNWQSVRPPPPQLHTMSQKRLVVADPRSRPPAGFRTPMGPATPPINTAHYTNLTVQSNVTFINHFHGTSREPQASTASWSEGATPLGTPQLRDTTKLVLTTGDPYNAEYCTVDGHIRYRMVLRSRRLLLWESRRWVTVDKAVSTGSPAGGDRDGPFERIGEVKFRSIFSSTITFQDAPRAVHAFFRKESSPVPSTLGRCRIFDGPDGKEYRWELGPTQPLLYRNNDSAHVAKFLPGDASAALGPQRAILEIYPAGERMVDLIVITLVYIEKLRRDRENNVYSH